jgi:predicted aldo/keto reductase-like oxidoreductase
MIRRTFVGSIFAGLGLTGRYARAAKPKAGDIPMREFGKTGIKLSVIGQGGVRLKLLRTKEAAREHVRYVLDLGLNYWDCAHSYWEGHSEEVYGDALAGHRKELFLTSKSTKRDAKGAETELHKTLERYRSDYVDLWQMHGVNTKEDVEGIFAPGGAVEAFEAAKKSGKARFIGVTGHADPFVLNEMLDRYDKFDSILMPLHAADPSYLSFEKNTLPKAAARGIGIQAMKVFGNAFLLRVLSARECLQYSLSLPIHCATVGFSSSGQADDDYRIAQELTKPLPAAEMELIRERAVTEGPGGATGTALEYWKRADA